MEKKKAFTIDSIWIEFEFSIPTDVSNVMDMLSDYMAEWNNKNPSFTLQIDREYYSDQVEFKLMRTPNLKEWIEYFQSFIRSVYSIFPWIKATTKNHYVGCHIHYFINKDGELYTKFAQGKKIALVRMAYTKVCNWITLYKKMGINKYVARDEMSRLARNHNILRYFDSSIWDALRNNLEEFHMTYQQFHNGTDRPKYTPVLWSLPSTTTWKPHSLEVRCIPNSFFLIEESSNIMSIGEGIEDILNKKWDSNDSEDIEAIASSHRLLLQHLQNL